MSEYEGLEPERKRWVERFSGAQWTVAGLAIASAVFAGLYRTSERMGMVHTSAMFIGIPAVLAIILAMTPKAKSATGAILKGITFVLLIMAPLVGEGVVCILMAAPLFYFVGVAVGASIDWSRKRRNITLSCCALALLPMSLEGVVPQLTFDRLETVSETAVVAGTPDDVERALAASPKLNTPMPGVFAKVGFPRPLRAWGEGLEVGDRRTIHFEAAEGAPEGDVVMRVSEHGPGLARFEAVSDSTKVGKWLRWDDSMVTWRAVDAAHTEVTWRIEFERQLDPVWYFGPWERVAVRDAARFLIAANATPER
jgi:hypothetical protein